MRRRAAQGGGDRGQATVEMALVLPLLALLALVIVQVALVGRDQVLVVHAAREAARAAAVDPDPGAARRAALAGSRLDPARLEVRVHGRGRAGSRVRVLVRYRAPVRIPVLAAIVPDVTLEAAASMRVER